MKHFFSLVLLVIITSCGSTKNNNGSQIEDTTLLTSKIADISIEGMACQEGCADAIQANLVKIEGVNSAEVSFESGKAKIEFDPSLVSSKEIRKTITDTKVKDYNYIIKDITITNKITE